MCDLNAIDEYFDSLAFGEQLELLGGLASRLKPVPNNSNYNSNEPTNNEVQAAYNALGQEGGSCGCDLRGGGGRRGRKTRGHGHKRSHRRHLTRRR